jgi:hypothetical protein
MTILLMSFGTPVLNGRYGIPQNESPFVFLLSPNQYKVHILVPFVGGQLWYALLYDPVAPRLSSL